MTALNRRLANQVRHLGVDDLPDASRRCDYVACEKLIRNPLAHRLLGRLRREFHPAAEKVGRIEVAEDEIGVGDGWFLASPAVAGGAGRGAGALRPDPQSVAVD